ncbi:MAG: hypothetical protein HDR19_05395 [Lachnospiraceae bacterium]|nr:hypothetical protein [Lachnospiraceae bacterium]
MMPGLGIGITSSNRYTHTIKDANGKVVGRISSSKGSAYAKAKAKRVNYNMRQISSKILKSKTSGTARMAWTGAKNKVAQLKRQLNDYGVDRYELEHAIVHAMQIARVAKKKMKHLQEEEAAKKGGLCEGKQVDMEEDLSEEFIEGSEAFGTDVMQEVARELERDMQRKMERALQEEMQKLLEEITSASGLNELSEDLLSVFSEDMDPEDLEAMKKKHRSEELKAILEADMKYLKAMFNKLQREKEANASGASNIASNNSPAGQSVSLELGGAEMPVNTGEMPEMVIRTEGVSIDVQA